MVISKYIDAFGSLGNNLFQYAIGRIIAEETGMYLDCDPIPWFKNTHQIIDGKKIYTDQIRFIDQWLKINNDKLTIQETIEACKNHQVLLSGWFQRYEYYKPYKNRIRQWFEIDDNGNHTQDDLILHLRLGDYIHHLTIDVNFYKKALDVAEFDRLYICSDPETQNHSIFQDYLKHFKKYNPIILKGGQIEDFRTIKSFNKIILSQSTYSWWAAFLSDAKEIYFPVPEPGPNGHLFSLDYSPVYHEGYSSVRLFVDDESRYKYLKQNGSNWNEYSGINE